MAENQNAGTMPEKNLERAKWAEKALETFGSTGVRYDVEPSTAVGDLLGGLMHLCDRDGLDFEDLLGKGRQYYENEIVCCVCGVKLVAGDDASGCDAVCKKCGA